MYKQLSLILFIITCFYPSPIIAWGGYESITGDYVDLDPKDIKKHNVIEYYDHNSGTYRTGIIDNVYTKRDTRKIELQDLESSSYRNFDMDNVKNNRKILNKYYDY